MLAFVEARCPITRPGGKPAAAQRPRLGSRGFKLGGEVEILCLERNRLELEMEEADSELGCTKLPQ